MVKIIRLVPDVAATRFDSSLSPAGLAGNLKSGRWPRVEGRYLVDIDAPHAAINFCKKM